MLPAVADLAVASVDRAEVLRYLGHRGQHMDADLAARVDAAIASAAAIARPRVAMRSFAVAARVAGDAPELHLAGSSLVLAGASIARHLADADEVVVMAVTTGLGVDRELHRRALAGTVLDQVLLDAAATAIVEDAANAAEALVVADAAERGCGATWRFSPGYGDLPLACQSALIASVDATRRLGVTLTDANLLVPTKSVTAVVGVGARVTRGQRGGCATCNLRDRCTVRRAGATCRTA